MSFFIAQYQEESMDSVKIVSCKTEHCATVNPGLSRLFTAFFCHENRVADAQQLAGRQVRRPATI